MTLEDLENVDADTASIGDVLTRDVEGWIASPVSGVVGGATRLRDLTDVASASGVGATNSVFLQSDGEFSVQPSTMTFVVPLKTNDQATPGENYRAANTMIQAAQIWSDVVNRGPATLGLPGAQPIVDFPGGVYKMRVPYTAMLTQPFTTGTSTSLYLDDVREFPSSGTVAGAINDDGFALQVTRLAESTITWTGVTVDSNGITGRLTGVTTTSGGAARTFQAGDAFFLTAPSHPEANLRNLMTVDKGNVQLRCASAGGCKIDMSASFYRTTNAHQGPIGLQIGVDSQTNTITYGKGNIWPGQTFTHVGRTIQPNSQLDGTYEGSYQADDWITLTGDGINDWDAGRYNPPGEYVWVSNGAEWGGYLSSTLDAAVGSGGLIPGSTSLQTRKTLSPANAYATAAGGVPTGAAGLTPLVTDDPGTLQYANGSRGSDEAKRVTRDGVLYVTDGVNEEWLHFEGSAVPETSIKVTASATVTSGTPFSLTVAQTAGLPSSGTMAVPNFGLVTWASITDATHLGGALASVSGTLPVGTYTVPGELRNIQRGKWGTSARTWAPTATTILSGAHTVTAGTPFTMTVVSTAGMVGTGAVWIPGWGLITYTGVTDATHLAGCVANISGTIANNTPVTQRALILAEFVRVGSETIAHTNFNFNTGNYTILKRGVNGTTVATHTVSTSEGIIKACPIPGRVFNRYAVQHRNGYSANSHMLAPTAYLGETMVSISSGDTAVNVQVDKLKVAGLYEWPLRGAARVTTTAGTWEDITWTHRDRKYLYNVTRAVHGTLPIAHSVGDTIVPIGEGGKLTAPLASTPSTGSVTVSVNGFNPAIYAVNVSPAYFMRIDDEVLAFRSTAVATSGTTAGRIYAQGLLSSGVTSQQDTIPLDNITNFPDPVALGVGWCFAYIDTDTTWREAITYTGITTGTGTTGTLTGVRRGYRSKAQTWSSATIVRSYTAYNMNRANGGTAALAHTTGQFIRQVEPYFTRLAQLTRDVVVEGLEFYGGGTAASLPRIASSGPPGGNYTGNRRAGIYARFVKGLIVRGCKFTGVEHDGINQRGCKDVHIHDSIFEHIVMQGWGYSITNMGTCEDIQMHHNTFRHCRHGGDADGAPGNYDDIVGYCRRLKFHHNLVFDTINAGWESHPGNEDIEVDDNWFISCQQGLLANDPGTVIRRNTFIGSTMILANLSLSAGRYLVEDNMFFKCGESGAAIIHVGIDDQPTPAAAMMTISVSRNTFVGGSANRIEFRNKWTPNTWLYGAGWTAPKVKDNMVYDGIAIQSTAGDHAHIYLHNFFSADVTGNMASDLPHSQEFIYGVNVNKSIIGGGPINCRSIGDGKPAATPVRITSGDGNMYVPAPITDSPTTPSVDFTGCTNSEAYATVAL